MKRKFTVFCLAMLLIQALSMSASAAVTPEVRNSVAVVQSCMALETSQVVSFGWGTGFFVNDQYLVTNFHVISDFVEYGSGELMSLRLDETTIRGRAKIRIYYGSTDYEEAYVVGYDEIKDIAIIRLDKATTKRNALQLKEPTEEMVGNTIYAIGYPGLAEDILVDATTSWGENDSTVTSGTISRLFTQSGTGQRNVQIDCDIKHGNSGGPVVDESGAAIGVATWGISNSNQESMKYAVSISEVIPLLNQYSVDYMMAGSASVDDPAVQTFSEPITLSEPAKSSNNLIYGVVAGIIVTVAGTVVVIILLKRKRVSAPSAPSAVSQPHKRPLIRSYSKANYGVSVYLSGQPAMIGRSGGCAMQFPQNAPGVSGSHCIVKWDETTNDFVVTDLNSSYGTFLITGQKMTPNVPYRLRAGDKFYLADQNNVIGLELE